MAEDKNLGYGRVGAVAWIRRFWTNEDKPDEVMAAPYMVGSRFAISEADARRLWGWRGADEAAPAIDAVAKPADGATKRPTTWTELIPWPDRKVKGFEWPDDLRLIVVLESKRRHDLKHSGVTASMAKEFGCTDRNLRKVISGKGSKDSRGKSLAAAAVALSNGTDGAK